MGDGSFFIADAMGSCFNLRDKKVPPVKNLLKNPVFYLFAIFVLGGLTAVASFAKCGAPCDFAASQAADISAALVKAKSEQATADRGEAAMPVPGAQVSVTEVR